MQPSAQPMIWWREEAECSPRNWQTVSSRRGPIYRARIYVYTHKMTNGNACAVMWKCVFNNVKTRN